MTVGSWVAQRHALCAFGFSVAHDSGDWLSHVSMEEDGAEEGGEEEELETDQACPFRFATGLFVVVFLRKGGGAFASEEAQKSLRKCWCSDRAAEL